MVASQLTISEARKQIGRILEAVKHERPAVVVTRGHSRREAFIAFDVQKMSSLLHAYRFSVEYEVGEDGRYYGSLDQISDIIGEGDTFESLRLDLAQHLIEYAKDYERDFALFFNAPNRRDHFPYVMNVLLQEDSPQAVVELFR